MLAIIGGTGLYDFGFQLCEKTVETPFGLSVYREIEHHGKRLIFLPRHGANHILPPHKILYKANLFALQQIGVKSVLATAAAGAILADFTPGTFGIVTQFMDFTKNRDHTFYHSFEDGIHHTDMTHPYSVRLNTILESALISLGYSFKSKIVLAVTEGPRFETPAEIKAFSILGADAVNMTSYPEVSLANELGIEYSSLCISTNFAAGYSDTPLTHLEVEAVMNTASQKLQEIVGRFINSIL
ncbi:MAG: MTAP family purine nucleoside phosphorylase [Caldisericia bacterium]|nr:MTAP family purine nucleoside phosphorylase [Caldisericia bacterium]